MIFGAPFSLRQPGFLKRRDASRYAAVALGLCVIAGVWTDIFASLAAQRAEALRGAALNVENLAQAFEENIVRTFSALDQSLRSLRRAYAATSSGFDINGWATTTTALTEMDVHFAVTDKDGIVTVGTLTAPGTRIDLSTRPHFLAQRDAPGDELYFSKPIVGQSSQEKVVILARKVLSEDGSFNGIVLGSLNLDYLTSFYHSVNLGSHGIVRLVGLDGIVRVRAGAKPADDEAAFGQNNTTQNLLAHFARAPSGTFIGPSQTDGIVRVFAYRATRRYPFIVQTGIDESEVLARFHEDARHQYMLGGVVTLLAVAVMTMYLVSDARLRRARDAAEDQYAYKKRLLERTVANVTQGILVLGADNEIQLCNTRLIDMLDLPENLANPQAPVSDLLHWLWSHDEFADPDRDFNAWLAAFLAALRGPATSLGYEHIRPNGVILDVRTALLPDGGVVRSYTDITDRKLEAKLLQAAQEGAARATEAKSAFLATMSHEIRSPLSGLIGVLDLLRATPLEPEQRGMADMIHNSGKMLLAVLNDILDFSKIESGALSVTSEPADIHALLAELVQPHVGPGREKGVAVSLAIDPAVPQIIMTDRLRVAQIVGNLLSNAMKFTASGSITVHMTSLAEAASAPRLRLTVQDSGIGMEAGTISRLFKPFAQADGTITRRFGGTGLGLCISQQLAGLLGGTITATSRRGEGSIFTLDLPCVAGEISNLVPVPPVDPSPRPTIGAGLRALLVDDDPTNRWLGERKLRMFGFTVDVAEDGLAGFEAIRAAPYDLLVTDLHMPRMSGIDLTQAVRGAADLAWRDLPIIGLTADTTDEQRILCHSAGMTELTIKPITAARLNGMIEKVFSKAGGDDQPAVALPAVAGAAPGLLAVPFDPQIFLEIFPPGDPDGAGWLGDYLKTADHDVRTLRAMFSEPHPAPTEIARVAHRLAGASFSAGAMLLGDAARALERQAKSDDPPPLLPFLQDLLAQHAATITAIGDFLSDSQPMDVHAGIPAA